jgi:hypothetical protein
VTPEQIKTQYPTGRKQCTQCGEVKLLSEFHFQRYKPRAGQDPSDAPRGRYRSNCKKCQQEYMRQRRITNIEELGVEYLENETQRVRDFYNSHPGRVEVRRAVDRARYSAYARLRQRYPKEFTELLVEARREEGVPDDFPR